ncbi:unnamed protein product [Paramecium octaurelia]|uniref:Nudix hydrolase domain-containing protein n=1 Tax=Paramecium octaurelia TaxID=43137 RepID=A0A8S1TL77_PAROT|nr:unnamed protein product [Paramecium octaurelia]
MDQTRESLLCRFIVNLDQEEKKPDRLFFHLQNAYWYYLDFLNPEDKMSQTEFYSWLLNPLSEYNEIRGNLKHYLKQFKQYQKHIPLYGAILLNETLDCVLLVMNYNQTVYSFPKGKVNKNESGVECAIREVWEEVGYDISKKISDKDYLEFVCEDTGQPQRMYIICGVSEDHKFTTSTRYEIGSIQWVQIKDIQRGDSAYVYLNPFIQGLQKYIQHKKQLEKSKVKNTNQTSESDLISVMFEKTQEILKSFKQQLKQEQPRQMQQPQFQQFKLIIA